MEDRHKFWLEFARKIIDVPLEYSKDDFLAFRSIAMREQPALVQVIEAFIQIIDRSELDIELRRLSSRKGKKHAQPLHLFDLLRSKQLFPQNLDLAKFASRVMPHMRSFRFDKMSRSDMAARIIEHVEQSNPPARKRLEESMTIAMAAMRYRASKKVDRYSYLSKWEKIIRDIQF